MIILSDKEVAAFKALSLKQRRTRLKEHFLNQLANTDKENARLSVFFDQGFSTAMTLPSISDREILRLCWIAYYKQTTVASTVEYRRCQREHIWPGRSLYLCASLENLSH